VQFSTNGLTLLSLLHKSHKACPFSIRTQFDFEFSGLRVMAAREKASVAIKLLHIALTGFQGFGVMSD
jgi:RNA polymerase subunit RPABC4/transcription elongation factor Spt4